LVDVVATAADEDSVPFQREGICWLLPMRTITEDPNFVPGRAETVAIALISNGRPLADATEPKPGRLFWWGHPVHLAWNNDAVEYGLGRSDRDPSKYRYEDDPVGTFLGIRSFLAPDPVGTEHLLAKLWSEPPSASP